ncbi:MAG: tripartite tricarboxylate transporter TctB family protein, partial [Peptococcales bacterium]
KYGLWSGTSPGAGFLPAVSGGLLIFFSIWILTTPVVIKEGALQKRAFYPIAAAVLGLGLIPVLGFILSMGLFVFLWLLVLEKFSVIKATAIGVCSTLFIYFVFKVWLTVPFPKGLLNIL